MDLIEKIRPFGTDKDSISIEEYKRDASTVLELPLTDNYEQKYKEALEKAKTLINEQGSKLNVKEISEYLFPELKESEDEKIRKALINYFKHVRYNGLDLKTTNIEEVLDWLEKQKEPDWAHHCVDLSECSEEYRKAYYDGWNNCNMQHSQKENEDHYVIRCLLNYFNHIRYNENATWGTDKFHMKVADIIKWLEEQKTFNEVTEECERMLCEHLKEKYEF